MSQNQVIKIGNIVKIFLSNNFVYEGKVIAIDDNFLKIIDTKTNSEKVFPFVSIINIDVKQKVEVSNP